MKINKLDLAKTISDFMFLGVNNPEEKAKVVFELKHSLTAHGFERYMQYYFRKFYKLDIKLTGGTNDIDGGFTKASRCFEKEQLEMKYDDNYIITETPSNKEVFDLLKQVKRDISYIEKKKGYTILTDNTLKILSRSRPHNMDGVKAIRKKLSYNDQTRILRYGPIFLERLKYLNRQELTVDEVKTDSYFNSIYQELNIIKQL